MESTLVWTETSPGRLWRTPDGQFLIMAVDLPEPAYDSRPGRRVVYQARWVSEVYRGKVVTDASQLTSILLGESHSCWYADGGFDSAEGACERKAWALARPGVFNVPEDHAAAALSHFWWPIGDTGGRGALAVVWKGDRLVAQVLGMSRLDDDQTQIAT